MNTRMAAKPNAQAYALGRVEVIGWHRGCFGGWDWRLLALGFLIIFICLGVPKLVEGQAPREIPAALRLAAEAGDPKAQRELAIRLERGDGGLRDERAALAWYKQAAEAGDAPAQFRLGQLYALGLDREAATAWYRRAAAQGHAGALAELRRLGTWPSSQPDPAGGFIILQPRAGILSHIADLNERARDAERLVLRALEKGRGLDREMKASLAAEEKLSRALAEAWGSIAYTSNVPVSISEPLRLAFLQLQVEVRYAMGAEAWTTVPALAAEPGCRGDLVEDNFFTRWGDAVAAAPLSASNDSELEVQLLAEFARQVACLSARQLARLEIGLSGGFFQTSNAMADGGLIRLVPAFARLTAPLQTVLFDATKHRGMRSASWLWFRAMRSALQGELADASWGVSDTLYLWDRQNAMLVGHPVCRGAQPAGPACIKLPILIDSFTDPRALAAGDCAFAAMVAHGFTNVYGDELYACPALPCTANANTPVDPHELEAARNHLNEIWPDFGSDQLLTDEAATDFCRNLANLQNQDELPYAEECLDAIFQREANPWDTYAACIVEGTSSEPELFVGFTGVPMGVGCGLFDGGEEFPGEGVADASAARSAADAGMDLPEDVPDFIEGLKQVIEDIVEFFSGSGGTPSGTSRSREDISINLNELPSEDEDEQDAKNEALQRWERGEFFNEGDVARFLRKAIRDLQEGKITDRQFRRNFDIAREAARLIRERGGVIHCLSPETCANTCTGLGSQLAAVQTCTKDLLDALLEAAGRDRAEPVAGQEIPPIDIVANYHPDYAPVDESEIPACLVGGSTAPSKPSAGCGLMHCGNAIASSDPAGGCSCGTDLPAFVPTRAVCLQIDCGPDAVLGSDCQCRRFGEDGAVEGWPQPSPGPMDRERVRPQ